MVYHPLTVCLISQIPLTLFRLFVFSITLQVVHSQNGAAGGFYECYQDQRGNKKSCGLYDDASLLCEGLSSTEKTNCVCGAVNFYLPTVSPRTPIPYSSHCLKPLCLTASTVLVSRCIAFFFSF